MSFQTTTDFFTHTVYECCDVPICDGLEHDSLSFHNFIVAQNAGTANSDIVPFCLNDRKIYIQLNKLIMKGQGQAVLLRYNRNSLYLLCLQHVIKSRGMEITLV